MDSFAYSNPYNGTTLASFFVVLIGRLWGFMTGQLTLTQLASDELQIIVLIGVALSSALVGSFLILRRMTMLANSLSHTILLGIVAAYYFTSTSAPGELSPHPGAINVQAMLIASLAMGMITTFLTQGITTYARLQEDASTGIVFTSLFALGIILVTVLSKNAHIGTEVVMGNVDALQLDDCLLVYISLLINLLLIIIFFKEYLVTTFDPALAKAMGISVIIFNYMLMAQVSITTVSAFRAVGVLMVLAFITGPPLTARLLTHDLRKMLALACALGSFSSIIGVALSRHLLTAYEMALTTAGIVVCVIAILYGLVASFTLYTARGHKL
jgi:manganese/zinc/iron transport system permease protein